MSALLNILLLLQGFNPSVAFGEKSLSTLDIAAEDAAGPWSYKDGTGFANDLVVAAFKAAGVAVHLKIYPYSRCKYLAVEGLVAACFSMSPEAELKDAIIFPKKALFALYSDLYQNKNKRIQVTAEGKLPKGTTIGIVTGYEYPEEILNLKKLGIVLQEGRSEETNLKKLAMGRIDLVVVNNNETKPAKKILKNADALTEVEMLQRVAKSNAYIGFSKKHADGMKALENFNRGYKIIQENGIEKSILKKWIRKTS